MQSGWKQHDIERDEYWKLSTKILCIAKFILGSVSLIVT